MHELTLTGGTLLSDGPTTTAKRAEEAALTTGGAHTHHTHGGGHRQSQHSSSQQQHAHHDHHHAGTTHHSHRQCCSPTHVGHLQPVLTLKKPAAELVQEYSREQMYHTVQQVVRMGSYELLVELISAWREHVVSSTTTSSTAAAAAAAATTPTNPAWVVDLWLHEYDDAGHTLTHWAAKRVDDVRIVQYFLQQVRYTAAAADDDDHDGTANHRHHKKVYLTPAHRPTRDDTAMTPLHWACTQDTALAVVKALLDAAAATLPGPATAPSSLVDVRDGTGCTPLLIAAQHGHVETVAYLIQKGADSNAVDASKDSATHWAAYKGSSTVLGLLSFYDTRQLQQPDAYGQTPLHLAALRGHVSVVRYILQQLLPPTDQNYTLTPTTTTTTAKQARTVAMRAVKELLYQKDQNGRTPYELAVHKEKTAVAAVLQRQADALQAKQSWPSQLLSTLTRDRLQKLLRPRTCKVWLGLPEVDDVDESPKFPFYYVIAHCVLHAIYYATVFVPLFNTAMGVLWDCMVVHVLNALLMGGTAYCLYQSHVTNPGRLDRTYAGIQVWRRLYEQTLDAFASSDERVAAKAATVQLCHTCHIARPARSKHDRFSRTCVLQFDHHCPFVGTTVGLYNYKWFLAFLIAMTLYLSSFLVLLGVYYHRASKHGSSSTFVLVVGLVMGLHVFFPAGMLLYHAQLVYVNLTTNEHLNVSRYDYLWEPTNNSSTGGRRFYNPWNKGCWGNLLDRFQPGDHCYLLPEQERTSERQMLVSNSKDTHYHGRHITTNLSSDVV